MSQIKKPPNKSNASHSNSVIRKGAQSVSNRGKNADERAVVLASTLRALQLRNGKGGSFGTGEVVRISGREKLELLAEDEMEKARENRRNLYEDNMNTSLKAPFQLGAVLRIAQSQMDAYIDVINALHDPALCYDIILQEAHAHAPPSTMRREDPFRDSRFAAEQFGTCAHNAYMLASGWGILHQNFRKLQDMDLRDKEIRTQLRSNSEIRDVYFSAYELLKRLVTALQHRLRLIVQNTPHYAPYFKASSEVQGCQEFEKSEIKRMYKSFLDSAVIELCLPGSKFSPQALYFCLHTTQEETPKLLKRCPQLMWDAIGDLAEAVKLLDVMETPLINLDAQGETKEDFTLSKDLIQWNEAQKKSVRGASMCACFAAWMHPLECLKLKAKLDAVWEHLNSNYVKKTGQDVDALWHLVDARRRVPHFSTLTDSESTGKELVLAPQNGSRKQKRKGNTGGGRAGAGNGSDSEYSSMPSLKAISNSEDEYGDFTEDDSEDDEDDSEDEEYDSDAEEELKRQQREAIDRALEDPDVLDMDNDKYAEERKKNPLLALLGNLRGRLFTSSAILRTDEEPTTAPRPPKPSTTQKPTVNAPTSDTATLKDTPPKIVTVEDADDESDAHKSPAAEKKKKKHKKKKKKKSSTGTADAKQPLSSEPPTSPVSPASEPPRSPSPSPQPQAGPATPASPPQTPQTEKKAKKNSPSSAKTQTTSKANNDPSGSANLASTTTLPLPQEQKAPSAHSYLKERAEAKTKVKTRREPAPEANTETVPEKRDRKGGLFGRFKGDTPKDDSKKKQDSDLSVFARLKKKTTDNLKRLLGVERKGSLKWEQFLQVMRELGFDYDPSTAGSSVRFDPPNPDVRSISFHKPHPDSTLHQYKLKEYRAKLEDYYGWSPEVFKKAMAGVAGVDSDSDY